MSDTKVFAFAELDSFGLPDPEAGFIHCDLCGKSSLGDICGDEVRPFYSVPFDGHDYKVCVECLDEWMEPDPVEQP